MGRRKPLNLQARLVIGFLIAAGLTGLVATMVGIHIINAHTLDMLHSELRQDINTATLIYNYHLERLASQVQFVVLRYPLTKTLRTEGEENRPGLQRLIRKGPGPGLDMLTVIDRHGTVVFRAGNPAEKGDSLREDPVIRRCLQNKAPVTSTARMALAAIARENPTLANRARIALVQTPQAIPLTDTVLQEGLVLRTAYPILDGSGDLLGVLSGGILLNRDYTIVDAVKAIEYRETYQGHDMGFSTIFLGGVRIATNVIGADNQRAIGTLVSRPVYARIMQGQEWIGRAFVVNDWYMSAYVPIHDLDRHIIGMLYTGILEAKYRDLKLKTLLIFLGVTTLGMAVAFCISYALGSSIIRRIGMLKKAAKAIASGDLDYRLPTGKASGFDILDEAFNNMASSLRERDERLQKAFSQITSAERLAALGQMAAGMAHEINNPLGGILLYANLVLEDTQPDDPRRANLQKIISQTHRCKEIVQNLLDFARTPSGEMVPLDINKTIQTAINLVKDQPAFAGITIAVALPDDLPTIYGDHLRLEEVFLNLFLNAADALQGKGKLTIRTAHAGNGAIQITVADTGRGIEKAYLPHIFDPFFSTKEPGQGTGLGLSITYGIIRNHHGSIHVQSEPGQGTVFTILLPIQAP